MDDITIEYYDERVVHIADENFDHITIKDIFDMTKKYHIEFRDFKNELCRIYHGTETIAGLINPSKNRIKGSIGKYILPAGEYISYTFFLDSYSEFSTKEQELDEACNQLGYKLSDDLIHIEHFAKTYYGKDKFIIAFQKRIIEK